MLGIREELLVFLVAVMSGAIVRLMYGCISCFRQIVKHRQIAIELEDLLFWIGSSIYLFVQIYHTSAGSIRWNFILGVVVGAVIMTIIFRKKGKLHEKNLHLKH